MSDAAEHEGLKVVQEIQDDIQDRYKDHYAILKELIQNADDAEASVLHIAYFERIPGTQHELLHGPLIAVINDSEFTDDDAAAIQDRRSSTKSADGSKIGKFGLGLKSVFHLCEAFLFVSNSDGGSQHESAEALQRSRSGIYSPWGRSRFASRLTVSDDDFRLLREKAVCFLEGDATAWLAIFIPLRLRSHCVESVEDDPDDYAIKEEYFDHAGSILPGRIFGKDAINDLCRLLPLMSTLNRIALWRVDEEGMRTSIGSVSRTPHQHVNWGDMQEGRHGHAGRIEFRHGESDETQVLRYFGWQELMNREALAALPNSEKKGWPKFWKMISGAWKHPKAAATQHVAVVLLESAGHGDLRFTDTIFFPLGPAPGRIEQLANDLDFEFLMHGYYFPDSGRNAVDRKPENRPQEEETVRQEWNRMLQEKGVLPLLIPTLKSFAATVSGDLEGPRKVERLTELIADSQFFCRYQPWICQSHGWAYRLHDHSFSWSIVAIDDFNACIELPKFGDDYTLPTTVFPSLTDHQNTAIITVSGVRKLFPKARSNESLDPPAGFYESLLLSVVGSDFAEDEKKLKYLTDAVTSWKRGFGENDFKALISVLKAILKHLTAPSELQKKNLKRLIGVVPDGMLLPISLSLPTTAGVSDIFCSMLDCSIDALPIPAGFEPVGDRSFAKLSTEHVRVLLLAVIGVRDKVENASNEFTSASQAFINDTLNAWNAAPRETFEVFKDLSLFHGRQTQATMWLNASTLMEQNISGSVFEGEESSLEPFMKSLDATEQRKLIFLTKKATPVLCKWIGPLPKCDVSGFLKLLKTKPKLSTDLVARSESIEAITGKCELQNNFEARKGIRYLLHGTPTAVESTASLLVDAGDAWSAMAMAILCPRDEAWRLIPQDLVNFKPTERLLLAIHDCTPETVSELLNGFSVITRLSTPISTAPETLRELTNDSSAFASIDCQRIVNQDGWYKSVLEGWPKDRISQLKKLTAFPRSDSGQLVAITNNTFIEGKVSAAFDSVFPERVFVRDKTGILRSRELVPTVEPEDLIAAVLRQDRPSTHWKAIMDSLVEIAPTKQDGPDS